MAIRSPPGRESPLMMHLSGLAAGKSGFPRQRARWLGMTCKWVCLHIEFPLFRAQHTVFERCPDRLKHIRISPLCLSANPDADKQAKQID